MIHLFLLSYFLPLCIGLFILGLLTLLYFKNRDSLLRFFLFFFSIFTVQMILNLFSRYYSYNIHGSPLLFIFVLRSICPYALIYTGIIIVHEIFEVKYYRCFNILFLIVLTLSFLFELIEDLLIIYNFDSFITNPFDEFFFILSMIYMLIIIIFYRKKIRRNDFSMMYVGILFASSFTLLSFILDSLKDLLKLNILISPFNYLVWIFFIIYFIVKYYSYSFSKKIRPTEIFIEKYKISKREVEIINQLLKGYSYKKICDENYISLSTVKTHISNIYRKIGINSRHELSSIVQKINSN